jgi:hypothetical protein
MIYSMNPDRKISYQGLSPITNPPILSSKITNTMYTEVCTGDRSKLDIVIFRFIFC